MKTIISAKAKSKSKDKKDQGTFTYEGESFSANPFAVCSDKIDKKKNPDKWERCVRHVKETSKT